MKKKKIALAERDKRNRARGRTETDGGGTWWGKMRSVTPSVPDNVPILKAEVTALEELSRFLFLEAHEVQNALERIEWSKSCQGMYFNFLGYFFSIYCVWKIFISTRGLLLTMSKFFIWISSSKSSNVLVLFFSQIMGMYFTSMVVLMRMNMPPEYRAIITSVLGDLQFNFYHRWFDVTFLVSATATLALLYLAHKREVETQDKSV